MAFDDLEWISDTVFHLGDRVWAQGREAAPFCVLTLPAWKLISLLKIYACFNEQGIVEHLQKHGRFLTDYSG